MRKLILGSVVAVVILAGWSSAQQEHPTLSLGSPAPNFKLPGVDNQVHRLSDYGSAKVLVVVFTCNHCPIAQLYEDRIQQLANDYRDKGVALVAIMPNDPNAIRIDELDSADMSDSLAEMKIRVSYRHLTYPYLYDGATQSVANNYGPKATPHVFVFDAQRILRFEGRIDDSYRQELVKTEDARNAINALLADQPVTVPHTGVFGCSTKWKSKEENRQADDAKINAEPVSLQSADADELRKLRANPTGKYLLVNFWTAQCEHCVRELPDLVNTFRMYRVREFDFVSVAESGPAGKDAVLRTLQQDHASNRNLLFASGDTAALQKAFALQWKSGVPFTVLLSPTGEVLYRKEGELDILDLRRHILQSLPAAYAGFQRYWQTP